MNKQKIKYHPNGNIKKEVLDFLKNGHEFKLIINYDSAGNCSSIMEKPDLKKLNPNILTSGAHVLVDSGQNHCDFFQSGTFVFKEYPNIRGSTNYGYTLS